MRHRPALTPHIARTAAAHTVALAVVAIALSGCGQKRDPAKLSPEQAQRLGLTQDALDPTQRDLDSGYYRWKPKPEAEGTDAPQSPDRRPIGGPNP